jgi:hypothetical protein
LLARGDDKTGGFSFCFAHKFEVRGIFINTPLQRGVNVLDTDQLLQQFTGTERKALKRVKPFEGYRALR